MSAEAFAFTGLGTMQRRHHDDTAAEVSFHAALAIVREYTDVYTEASVRINLGAIYSAMDLGRAREQYTAAVALTDDEEMVDLLVTALVGLGDTEHTDGRSREAAEAWRRAADLVEHQDPQLAAELRSR